MSASKKDDSKKRSRRFTRLRGWLYLFVPGVVLTMAFSLLHWSPPEWMRFLEYNTYDVLLRQRPKPPMGDMTVIVDIDEKSLATVGQWPWPRYQIALLLGRLKEYGALAVGMDIVFSEPDQTSPDRIQERLKSLGVDMDFTGLAPALRDNDRLLAQNLAQGPFVLGYFFTFSEADSAQGAGRAECQLPPPRLSLRRAANAANALVRVSEANSVVCPLPVLSQAGKWAGFFNSAPDQDNLVRWVPLVISWKDTLYPSLAISTLMRGFGAKNAVLSVQNNEYGAQDMSLNLDLGPLGKRSIPLDKAGRILLDFRGPAKTFPYISASDVIAGKIAPDAVAGKLVYIGTSARGLEDIRATPVDQAFVGVEAHATATDMILANSFLRHPLDAWYIEQILVVLLGIGVTVMLIFTRSAWVALMSVLSGAGVWFGATWSFNTSNYYLSPLNPLMVLSANFTLLTFLKFLREERQKRFIQSAFSQYLSPKVVDQIVAQPDKLTLTGEEKDVTILFSDVRGFTTLSEKLPPNKVVALLHEYLTPMTRLITENSGTLDKFIGDAIMAFWNAPIDVPGHPRLALQSAMGMLEELDRLNRGFQERYGFEIHIGIGLNVGLVRVGNFGSADLFDYTIIGDNVNLCSRLEGLTKYYHQKLLVTQAMKDQAGEGFLYQEIDRVLVKGKREPVTILTVHPMDRAGALAGELAAWDAALTLYRTGDFTPALAGMESLAAETGNDLYTLYAGRCRTLIANPPGPEWNGVFEHTTK